MGRAKARAAVAALFRFEDSPLTSTSYLRAPAAKQAYVLTVPLHPIVIFTEKLVSRGNLLYSGPESGFPPLLRNIRQCRGLEEQ